MATDPALLFRSDKAVQILEDACMDIQCVLEVSGKPPPAYFRERSGLDAWVRRSDLPIDLSNEHILVLKGWKRSGGVKFWFTQVWVRARYTRYRNRLKSLYLKAFRASSSDMDDIHADHVINRNSVAEGAWVQLFPVPARVNSMFGSRVEKFLPRVDLRLDMVPLPPLILFKLFCRTVPHSEQEWEAAIRQVQERILPRSPEVEAYRDCVSEDVRRAMKRDFSNARRMPAFPGASDGT